MLLRPRETDGMSDVVHLVQYLAWPLVVLVIATLFRDPLTTLADNIGRRAKSVSVFNRVKFEFSQLSRAPLQPPSLEALGGHSVGVSSPLYIGQAVEQASTSDYLVVDIGSDEAQRWLTSRLYLLAALLAWNRAIRCLVFVSGVPGEGRFLGLATPFDVRRSIGAWSPIFEKTFANALGQLAAIRGELALRGSWSSDTINLLCSQFLFPAISRMDEPPPEERAHWIELRGQNGLSFERAEWMHRGLLIDILGNRLSRPTVVAQPGQKPTDIVTAVIRQTGLFVAKTDRNGVFLDLIDRQALINDIAVQSTMNSDDEEATPRRSRRARQAPGVG